MAEQLQLRGASTSAVTSFTGAPREIVINTDNWRPVVQDGVSPGGHTVALLADLGSGQSNPNILINGGMRVDQINLGASITASGYAVDQWQFVQTTSGAGRLTIGQNLGAITPPVGHSNYLGVSVTTAASPAAADIFAVRQPIEAYNLLTTQFGTSGAKNLVLSFLVYSSLTGTFSGSLQNYAQTRSYPFSFTVSVAGTWTPVSIAIPGDPSGSWVINSNAGSAYLTLDLGSGTTPRGAATVWANANTIGVTGASSLVQSSGASL